MSEIKEGQSIEGQEEDENYCDNKKEERGSNKFYTELWSSSY